MSDSRVPAKAQNQTPADYLPTTPKDIVGSIALDSYGATLAGASARLEAPALDWIPAISLPAIYALAYQDGLQIGYSSIMAAERAAAISVVSFAGGLIGGGIGARLGPAGAAGGAIFGSEAASRGTAYLIDHSTAPIMQGAEYSTSGELGVDSNQFIQMAPTSTSYSGYSLGSYTGGLISSGSNAPGEAGASAQFVNGQTSFWGSSVSLSGNTSFSGYSLGGNTLGGAAPASSSVDGAPTSGDNQTGIWFSQGISGGGIGSTLDRSTLDTGSDGIVTGFKVSQDSGLDRLLNRDGGTQTSGSLSGTTAGQPRLMKITSPTGWRHGLVDTCTTY